MTLVIGSKLGPYEIVGPIGAGGMGEVYRALDTKLGRDVAIKILPEMFATDPTRMARFEREAKLLASLNHSNIASIFGLEDSEGIRALVMELVSGPTLADRLQKGPLPLDEALPIARQIAEGLEYAHEHGIVHRDLKPANIKLTSDGAVKILDFGLAKTIEDSPSSTDISTSPTISRMATQAGIILGTAAYMSPEQAKGKSVDRRTDIWAFGCVLFEMLSGKTTFAGETVTDVLAAVVMKDPDWSQLPDTTPPGICEVLQRCTKKEQKQRLQSIGDARITIEEVLSGNPDGTSRLALTQSRGRWQVMLPWAIAGILAVAAGFLLFHLRFGNDQAQQSIRFSILSPPKYEFAGGGTAPISPNGRYLVFTAAPSDGPSQLWIRSVDSLEAKVLPGTEGAYNPFWSPDSQWIAFNSNNKLKKISIAGSSPLEICDSGNLRGGSWGPDGRILFAPDIGLSVHSVSAAGGTPIPVLQLDTSISETTQRWPQFLPDGRHFLFFSRSPQNATYVGLLGSSERRLVLKNESNAAFAPPGHLLYVRNHTLMVQPFDTKRLELTGTAVAIAEDVPVNGTTQLGLFSASENGVLSIQTGVGKLSQPVWVDRSGKVLNEIAQPAVFDNLRVSPNGEKIAAVIRDRQETIPSIWMYDSSGQRKTRLTFGPYTAQGPTWSPDGNRIIYSSNAKGAPHMYSIPTSGIGQAELLIDSDKMDYPTSWSSDGRYLAFTRQSSSVDRNWKVWILPMSGDKKPHQLLDSSYFQGRAVFSPNGKWLAFETNENGQNEVYVTPFPSAKSKFLVSTGSGNDPQWSADGKWLYYQADDGTIMAASLQYEGNDLRVTGIQQLFKTNSPSFDVSPDGKRFLISRDAENQAVAPITLITNWPAALKK